MIIIILKKIVQIIIIILLIIIPMSSCNKLNKEKSSYSKIQKKLTNLKTYKAIAKIKYISNKGISEYNTYQESKITGEYRIEILEPENVKGNLTTFDGKTIYQYNPKVEDKISISSIDSKERTEILLTSFIKNYFLSEEVTVSVDIENKNNIIALEAKIPGEHAYISSQKLLIDNHSLKPKNLIIYDSKGIERIVVTYENFDYNIKLDENRFKIK